MTIKTHLQEKPLSSSPQVPTKSRFAPRPFAPLVEGHEPPSAESLGRAAQFGHSFADVDIFPRSVVQPKLRLGPAGDRYEREADQVARRVVETISSSDHGAVQRQDLEDEDKLDLEELEVEEEPMQGKFASGLTSTLKAKEEAPSNRTGMPDHLKSGLEDLSGMDLSDVRVHYNSPRPAQLNALAYTQGQDIHVRPGQEKHLPHEGWHAVQQMQGRVKPTIQSQVVTINDDECLENEADVMGKRANQVRCDSLQRDEVNEQDVLEFVNNREKTALQRKLKNSIITLTRNSSKSSTIQCAWTPSEVNKTLKKDQSGKDAVTDLNAQGYEVIHFDKYEFQRQFYTDATKTVKDGNPKKYQSNGWHARAKKEIALSDKRNNDEAASTLVHEVAHANQHKANEAVLLPIKPKPFPDTLAKELDAHIKQEEFNIAAGIAPKDQSFRNKKTGQIDKAAIKTYVERVYAVGAGKRYYTDTVPTYTVIETIKPWPPIL